MEGRSESLFMALFFFFFFHFRLTFYFLRKFILFLKFLIYFLNFWLCWVFVAAHRFSLVAASGGYSSLQCIDFSLWCLLFLQSTGSRAHRLRLLRCVGSVVASRGLSCPAACGIFPDQESNLCPLHWQADS